MMLAVSFHVDGGKARHKRRLARDIGVQVTRLGALCHGKVHKRGPEHHCEHNAHHDECHAKRASIPHAANRSLLCGLSQHVTRAMHFLHSEDCEINRLGDPLRHAER
jgi:hypothetical protein